MTVVNILRKAEHWFRNNPREDKIGWGHWYDIHEIGLIHLR